MNKIFLSLFLVISLISTAWANNGWYSTLQGTASDVEQTPPPNGVTIAYNTTDHEWEFNYGLAPAGGTTGTCLEKNSNSDYDYSWVSCSSGGTGTVTSSGSPSSGNIAKFTTSTNIAPAAYSDITALWSGCSGTQYLGADGNCHSPSGASQTPWTQNINGGGYALTNAEINWQNTGNLYSTTGINWDNNIFQKVGGINWDTIQNISTSGINWNDNTFLNINNATFNGTIGIGTTAVTSYGLSLSEGSASVKGINISTSAHSPNNIFNSYAGGLDTGVSITNINVSSTGSLQSWGVNSIGETTNATTGTFPIDVGVAGEGEYTGSSTISSSIGLYGTCVNGGSGTTTSCYSVYGAAPVASSGTITNSWAGYFNGDTYVNGLLDNNLTASELVATDSSNNLASITALPNGTTAITQTVGDNTTKVSTDAFVQNQINAGLPSTSVVTSQTTTTQSATPTIAAVNGGIYKMTALAQAITSMTTNFTLPANDGDIIEIRITDNGTARAITWGSDFESTTVTLPTTTVISTEIKIFLQYNSTASKMDCIGVA